MRNTHRIYLRTRENVITLSKNLYSRFGFTKNEINNISMILGMCELNTSSYENSMHKYQSLISYCTTRELQALSHFIKHNNKYTDLYTLVIEELEIREVD